MAGTYQWILPKGDRITALAQKQNAAPKRQIVSLACQVCRARKIKCDGKRTGCESCRAKGIECRYSNATGKAAYSLLLKDYRHLEQQNKVLTALYDVLKHLPESEAYGVFQRLRIGDDLPSLMSQAAPEAMVSDQRELGRPLTLPIIIGHEGATSKEKE
jgi:hypothetical protein